METIYQVKKVSSETEIEQCWEVVSLLRPHLNRDKWPAMAQEMMQNEKYCIAGIMKKNTCVAFAGYRVMTSLHSGNIMYIDDLCTLESHRGKGLAALLLDHVKKIASANNMDAVVLDTDFSNNTAQKAYLRAGYQLAALHLSCTLK